MRKIFIVIERRADYSRYKPILELLDKDPFFQTHLVVTGINLLKNHGEDIKKIISDGFTIQATLPMFKDKQPDNGAEMVRSMSRFMTSVVDELETAKPDLVLTGFDIGANLATTVAAAHMNLPVAHIQGGEITGNIDESLRHSMSKFAHIHFPATKKAKARLIRMGENPNNIFVVGCPSLDLLVNSPKVSTKDLEKELDLDLSQPTALVIQHPVTSEDTQSFDQINQTIQAIQSLNIQSLFLLPNNDAGYSKIIKKIKDSNLKWVTSLPIEKFVNLYRHIKVIVGNSSSGIHEAATYKVPAVNIGTRQQGRERARNVIDVDYDKAEIETALKKAIFDQEFRASLKDLKNPYGDGQTAPRIVKTLKSLDLNKLDLQKHFYE
jgi:GDP/UDP-N,N'-diacetylbacillosamine 2-epimerase (hydrolysing)